MLRYSQPNSAQPVQRLGSPLLVQKVVHTLSLFVGKLKRKTKEQMMTNREQMMTNPFDETYHLDEYWHETLAAAIVDANRWNGRACVVPAGDRFRVIGGAMSFALYVTIGCRYRDWEREAADRA
jgi:hypothetical protein